MRAAIYEMSGHADQVMAMSELPDPTPGPGEVRVLLHYSAVNPTDVKRRSVETPQFGAFQVPHHDGSGVIDRVGPEVSQELIGQRVWIYHAAHNRMLGSAAEYICLPLHQVVALPDDMPLVTGALVGIPMMTAAHALALCGDIEGKNVLITGGAGAVGSAAISLARNSGAYVITTVSSEQKELIAKQAGAHVCINHRSEDVQKALESQGKKINAVIDVAIGMYLPTYVSQLADQAQIASYSSDGPDLNTSVRPLMFANATINFFVIYNLQTLQIQQAVKRVSAALSDGIYPILPTEIFGLDRCAAAHEHVENRELGRAVLKISG